MSDHLRNIAPMQSSPRCERIKKGGERCRAPAVRGRKRCRAHGGKAGAPIGNQNALKQGLYTGEAFDRDRSARALIKQVETLLEEISAGSS